MKASDLKIGDKFREVRSDGSRCIPMWEVTDTNAVHSSAYPIEAKSCNDGVHLVFVFPVDQEVEIL